MAYRRKQVPPMASTFDDFRSTATAEEGASPAVSPAPPSSLAAQAIRASSAHRDSSLSFAYGESAIASARRESDRQRPPPPPSPQDTAAYGYTSMNSLNENESKSGFWGILARKAKAILEEDNATRQFVAHGSNQPQMVGTSKSGQFHQSYHSAESHRKSETPSFQRSSDAIASSLNYIGGTIKNALEEGLTIVENTTVDIIQETRKLQSRRKGSGPNAQYQAMDKLGQHGLPQSQTDLEIQLKASRDVANAMSAKAKLLLRELKTVKADLAFAKERCAQLEEENRILRESHEKGDSLEDDDLIRLQLETLLTEKGRLAHENSVYARENRFLREIVEYHQLTMQDVVYVDEGIEEVTEVCPIQIPRSNSSDAAAPLMPIPPPSRNNSMTAPPPPAFSIVVPQSCPIVPNPSMLSPSQSFKQSSSPNTRGSST